MQLLVTGGAGFIGSNFILYWLEQHPDDQIVNLDALTYAGSLKNLESLRNNPHYRFIKGDITNSEIVSEAIKNCEIVVHFAAETHVDRSILRPATFVQTNILGTQVLLDATRGANIRHFHHISTDEVFGSLELGSKKRFNETTPYNPHSPYSASKAGSDFLVRAYYDTYGLPITITNCSNNYGAYQFPEKLIPLVTLRALQDQNIPVYGDGKNIRDWIHTIDHARAIELVLNKGVAGETYCVGGESERDNLTIVKNILRILGKPESLIEFVADRAGHDRRYAIDHKKIKTELGYQPHYTFEKGLEETVEWYVANREWWEPIISGEYQTYYAQQYENR